MPADSKKRATRAGRRQVAFWIPEQDYDAWTAFVEGRGSSLTAEVLVAMARHMASPPPLPAAVPLPPPAPKRKPGRPKKVQNNS